MCCVVASPFSRPRAGRKSTARPPRLVHHPVGVARTRSSCATCPTWRSGDARAQGLPGIGVCAAGLVLLFGVRSERIDAELPVIEVEAVNGPLAEVIAPGSPPARTLKGEARLALDPLLDAAERGSSVGIVDLVDGPRGTVNRPDRPRA